MGCRCRTVSNFSRGAAPTLWVGESGVTSSVLLLQSGQLLQQAVEFRIGDHRIIQDIIAVIVVIDLLPELFYPGDVLGGMFFLPWPAP